MKKSAEKLDNRYTDVVSLQCKVHESQTLHFQLLTLKNDKIMARNVTYSVSPRINPRDKEAAPKYYGHAQASGDIDRREMSERIQQTCVIIRYSTLYQT